MKRNFDAGRGLADIAREMADALESGGGASDWEDISGKPLTFPPGAHDHDASYSALGHNHDASYAVIAHNHDASYDAIGAADAALATALAADFSGAYADLSGNPTLGDAAAKNTGTGAGDVAAGNHTHPGGGGAWGDITGTLSAQTDLQTALDGKQASGSYATAAQGTTADSALQPAGNGGSLTGLTKTQVGLANVDNTSDAAKPVSTATQTALDAKQATLVSATNIKTINSASILGSGDLVVAGAAPTSTGGVGASPNASGTQQITHGLGRTPIVIRIHGIGTKVSGASATNPCESHGIWNSSGNFCICRVQGASAGQSSSTAFAIKVGSGATAFCSGVIQNVGATTFDIAWTESGTSDTTPVYLWEAQ